MNSLQQITFLIATAIFIIGMMFGYVLMYKINEAQKIYAKVLA